MPIQIQAIPGDSLKDLIERANNGEDIRVVLHEIIEDRVTTLAREAQALQRPSTLIYIDSEPGVTDLEEGQEVYSINGADIRKYTKINGTIYWWALTAA